MSPQCWVAVVARGARQRGSSSGSFSRSVPTQLQEASQVSPPVLGSPSSQVVPGMWFHQHCLRQSISTDPALPPAGACRKRPGVATGVGVAVVAGCPACSSPAVPSQSMTQTGSCGYASQVSPPVLGSPSSQAVPGRAEFLQRCLRSRSQTNAVAGGVPGVAPVLGSPSSQVVPGSASSASGAFAVDEHPRSCRKVPGVAPVSGSPSSPRKCPATRFLRSSPSQSMSKPRSCRKHPRCRPGVGVAVVARVPGNAEPPRGSFAVDELARTSCRKHPQVSPPVSG